MENEGDPKRSIILSYLCDFPPAEYDDPKKILRSSAQIADDLADMSEFSLYEISQIMFELKYIVVMGEDHRPYWALLPR